MKLKDAVSLFAQGYGLALIGEGFEDEEQLSEEMINIFCNGKYGFNSPDDVVEKLPYDIVDEVAQKALNKIIFEE